MLPISDSFVHPRVGPPHGSGDPPPRPKRLTRNDWHQTADPKGLAHDDRPPRPARHDRPDTTGPTRPARHDRPDTTEAAEAAQAAGGLIGVPLEGVVPARKRLGRPVPGAD